MAVKNFYSCFTLSGDNVSGGIRMNGNELVVSSDSQGGSVLATSAREISSLEIAAIGRHPNGALIVDPVSDGEELNKGRVLVLVHEYSPGVGRKRWPSFYIDWENAGDVQVLAKASRSKGAGADYYKLVLAPTDWPNNIADQFVNQRDVGGQTIAYQPNLTKASTVREGNPSQDSPDVPELEVEGPMAAAMRKAGLI